MNQSSLWGSNTNATGSTSRQGLTGTGGMGHKVPPGYSRGQLQQFTPQQMSFLEQLIGDLGPDSYLWKLMHGDEEAFAETEAPALRQFNELQGNIASRFSGQGDVGGRRNSGFGHALTSASSNFAQDLQAKRQDLMRQARLDLYGLGQGLLGQRPYEQYLVEKPNSFLNRLGSTAAGAGVGAGTGFLLGGPKGAALGALAGGGKGYLSSE